MLLFCSRHSHESPIQSASVQVSRRWSLRPRLRLFADRLELIEWWGWHYVWCRLPLEELVQVNARTPTRLFLRTGKRRSDCTPLTLELKKAEPWARTIRSFRTCLDPDEPTGNEG